MPSPHPQEGTLSDVQGPPAGTTIKDGAGGGSQSQTPLTGHTASTHFGWSPVFTIDGLRDPPQIPNSMNAQVPYIKWHNIYIQLRHILLYNLNHLYISYSMVLIVNSINSGLPVANSSFAL